MNRKTTSNIIRFETLLKKPLKIFSPIILLFYLYLISGCKSSSQTNIVPSLEPKTISCPQGSQKLSSIEINRENYAFYESFDYKINHIIPDQDTITFETSNNDKFILCRANNNWTIETKALSESPDNLLLESNKTIEIKGKKYQYGVKIEQNSIGIDERVIFEFIDSESKQAKRQLLYNLEQTKQARAGVELGDPEILPPVVYGDRFFWSIFTYRGEGFGGITTIVSYDPTTDKITIIQPPEIATQIINDLVISGNPDNPTFWLATQLTAEGNPYLPSMGLVAYRPQNSDYTQGKISSYRVDNSPMVGAIPTQLLLENNILWVGTGNGICQVKWQNISDRRSWDCWRFALMADLPNQEIPVYSSLLNNTPETTLPQDPTRKVEVLWWLPQQHEPLQGRYEIEYEGRESKLKDLGAMTWKEYYNDELKPPIWRSPVYWVGDSWHWNGTKFVRGLDEVGLNFVGGGAIGIRVGEPNQDYIFDTQAIRGDLEILELTRNKTKVKYYSAWVEDSLLKPYITIVPQADVSSEQPNPLLEIKSQL